MSRPEVMYATNGLASAGRAAWTTVRAYLWAACFAGSDLFAGYAQYESEAPDDDTLTFHLLIDASTWKAADPIVRQERIQDANDRFRARLAELNLDGKLEIIIMSS